MAIAQILTAGEWKNGHQEMVYGWHRPDVGYLYIGHTTKGFGRIFDHDRIGIIEPFLDCDSIHIFEPSSNMVLQEQQLIQEHQPKYNITYKKSDPVETKCLVCSTVFPKTRFWQKYCSPKCAGSKRKYYNGHPLKVNEP